MDVSSPEIVAARALAAVTIERLVRDRTAILVWSAAAIAAILVVGAFLSHGIGAVIVGLFALVASVVAATLFAVRAAALRVLRRVTGGPDFARTRPIVERHLAELERARGALPLDSMGVVRLMWLARRPAALRAHVQDTASTLVRTFPVVVAEVRRELNG
jgi:hypothetical protein